MSFRLSSGQPFKWIDAKAKPPKERVFDAYAVVKLWSENLFKIVKVKLDGRLKIQI